MTLGNRLFNLARSELNSLLDRAVEAERSLGWHGDPDEDLYRRFSLDELTDAELEAEIERRHRARQAATEAAARARSSSTSSTSSTTGNRRSAPPSASGPDVELRRAYAALEIPFGSDFATARKSYRALMRKYHPDRHAGSPEKQKAATQLAQRLSEALDLIERHAGK